MKKKVTFLMLTVIALFASLSLGSCDKKDEPANKENYYLALYNVATNLVDEDGNSLTNAIFDEWVSAFGANSEGEFSMGKTIKENAIAAFDQSLINIKDWYQNVYIGKNNIPENGYFILYFSLDNESGSSIKKANVRVTNEDVTIN